MFPDWPGAVTCACHMICQIRLMIPVSVPLLPLEGIFISHTIWGVVAFGLKQSQKTQTRTVSSLCIIQMRGQITPTDVSRVAKV